MKHAAADPWGSATSWSLVYAASGKGVDTDVDRCWRALVERYREPIRCTVRRTFGAHPIADEAAEDFFAYLFEKGLLVRIDPAKGRFRAYVQGVLSRYLKSYRRAAAGAAASLSDAPEPACASPAALEADEERSWAEHVLGLALQRLLERHPRDGRILVGYYGLRDPNDPAGARSPLDRAALAAAHGISANAVDAANHRARAYLREAIRAELRETVATPADLEAETTTLVHRLLEAHPGLV